MKMSLFLENSKEVAEVIEKLQAVKVKCENHHLGKCVVEMDRGEITIYASDTQETKIKVS